MTEFESFLAIFVLSMETYFKLVWSRFSTNDKRIWNFSTLFTILCKNVSSTSVFAPAGISTFPVMPACLTKLMRGTNLWPKCRSEIVHDWVLALSVFQPKHWQLLWQLLYWLLHHEIWCFLKKFGSLSRPSRSNSPLFFALMNLLGDRFWDLAFLSSSWCCFLKFLQYSPSIQRIYLSNEWKISCFHFHQHIF